MKKLSFCRARLSILIALLLGIVACSEAPPPVDPAYAAEVEEWRANRLARLTADDGWLTLTGLYWLEPGDNSFGSAEDNAIVLTDSAVPAIAGRLDLEPDGTVTAIAEEGSGVEVNGQPLTQAPLATDAEGTPDVVTVGRIEFYIIERQGRLGARVKDPEAPNRTHFVGIENYPVTEAFRVEARLELYEAPRKVEVPTVLGEPALYTAPGVLHFTIDGAEQTLEPYLSGPENDRYFLIFRDATSGVTTYGAGRFLYTAAAGEDGATTIDFNLAYSPPCAFTPHATCPLPPPQNWLQASIEAGEMFFGEAH